MSTFTVTYADGHIVQIWPNNAAWWHVSHHRGSNSRDVSGTYSPQDVLGYVPSPMIGPFREYLQHFCDQHIADPLVAAMKTSIVGDHASARASLNAAAAICDAGILAAHTLSYLDEYELNDDECAPGCEACAEERVA